MRHYTRTGLQITNYQYNSSMGTVILKPVIENG